ncbi:hypothetical protein BDB00DRAFT_444888 [Zychaea mexicana]|uniref:uncharacterized protein n=1 Tax=Zychaea mexicana TaxID=64656 RepID=UPI0022FDD919|nr:uncharacterized protein BDB00DRAFT_444888 [Zychaea mexicana]KAI9498356.1 hypothetical protein BDB00DRAFT_444888 [Zychaea mexicana]
MFLLLFFLLLSVTDHHRRRSSLSAAARVIFPIQTIHGRAFFSRFNLWAYQPPLNRSSSRPQKNTDWSITSSHLEIYHPIRAPSPVRPGRFSGQAFVIGFRL